MSMAAGDNVVVDRRDALPREASKRRPAIVVEDSDLFDAAYPNLILVPLTDDPRLAMPSLSVPIAPTPGNGCPKASWAVAHHVTATSKQRIRTTTSRITDAQLAEIRRRIALSIGIDGD